MGHPALQRAVVAAVAAVLSLLWPAIGQAHPFESGYFGHLTRTSIDHERLTVEYRIEVPTMRLMREMREREQGGATDKGAGFSNEKLDELESGLLITVNGERVQPTRQPIGETGLGNSRFFIYDLVFDIPLPGPGDYTVEVSNGNYPDEMAYYANEIRVSDAVTIRGSSLLEIEGSTVTRDDNARWILGDAGRVVDMEVEVHRTDGIAGVFRSVAGQQGEFRDAADAIHVDPLIAIVRGEVTLPLVLLALLMALFFGAAHGFSPGHGKALVAGYLVGTRGTVGHAVLLGIVVTVSHTLSVIALGVVTLVLADRLAPEAIYPWIELGSGAAVLVVGATLIYQRVRRRRHHPHHDHHHHDHDHRDPNRGEEVSLAALFSLGVSGGAVPCPTALVVLLTAISLHRVALGLAMVGAFSLGLAAVLVAIAIAVVKFGDRLGRFGEPDSFPMRALPVASAVLVTAIGVGITVRSLARVLA